MYFLNTVKPRIENKTETTRTKARLQKSIGLSIGDTITVLIDTGSRKPDMETQESIKYEKNQINY